MFDLYGKLNPYFFERRQASQLARDAHNFHVSALIGKKAIVVKLSLEEPQ